MKATLQINFGSMMLKLVKSIVLTVFTSLAAPAIALEIEMIELPGAVQPIIMLSGEIDDGDAVKFHEAAGDIPRATVALSGSGGLIREAFSIGAEIHRRGFATLVLSETECYSACALIWLSGQRKYTSASSVIGVHAAYYHDHDGSLNISGAGNAEIGAYLAHVGLRVEAIRYITTAEPDEDFLYITPRVARSLGIEVYEQDGFETTTPAEAPSAPAIAYTVAELIAFDGHCGALLETAAQAERTARDLLAKGHVQFGGERFASLIPEAVDVTKANIDERGELFWCLDASVSLITAGHEVGIDGPAFNCAKASTENERTICSYPALWGLDRALAAFYGYRRSILSGAELSQMKSSQVAWLRSRQACGADVSCTKSLYYRRIEDLLR